MSDGRYDCRLLLRDREGRTYQERKSFRYRQPASIMRASLPAEAVPGSRS